jgi:hypothetical protein
MIQQWRWPDPGTPRVSQAYRWGESKLGPFESLTGRINWAARKRSIGGWGFCMRRLSITYSVTVHNNAIIVPVKVLCPQLLVHRAVQSLFVRNLGNKAEP